MSYAKKVIWTACLTLLITLTGCAGTCPQIPREALKPLPTIILPTAPRLNTKRLLDAQGKPAGLLFPTEDAFAEAEYKIGLKEAAELGIANTAAANKIFEILATEPPKWWQFWK